MSTGSGEFVEQWTAVSPQGFSSAHSSPPQLVPQLESSLNSLLLPEDIIRDVNKPFLKITEQPQGYYKFRYRSEMQNSHGCLHGKSYMRNSDERHFPGVELLNYNGPALIKCKLSQIDNQHEHPHRLCVNDISDISFEVPKGDSYKAWFSDLCIVHTPAREVTNWLYRGHNPETLSPENQAIVKRQCERLGKMINLNIVRLKFSAHQPNSGEEICAPVFSDPIRNLKCAATNILKICRLSRCHGRVRGGDDVFMLVERVIKKNIMIRFFELNENGEELWTDIGRFPESDVHHQYAIVFRFSDLCIVHTPAREVTNWLYRGHNPETLSPENQAIVKRQCERLGKMINLNIVRLKFSAHQPNSGEEICAPVFSDPIRNLKCAATNILKICRLSRCHGRVRGGDDVFMLVERVIKKNIMIRFFELNENGEELWTDIGRFPESDVHHQYAIVFRTPPYKDVSITKRVQVFVELVRPSDGKRSEAKEFFYTPEQIPLNKKRNLNHFYEDRQSVPVTSNSLSRVVSVNHTETTQAEESSHTQNSHMICDEKLSPMLTQNSLISQQSNENGVLTFKIPVTPSQMNDASSYASNSIAVNMVNDMDLFKNSDFTDYFDSLLADFDGLVADTGRGKTNLEASASKQKEENYDDQTIIKMMAKELQKIVEMIRIKRESFTKSLQALFDLRLSNGDTFLHLTLDSKQPLLDYLINLIHDSNLTHLLNLKNASAQTILHQAVANNLCDLIPVLVSKGCDPMLEDAEGNNAIHYGVKSEDSLGPLLDVAKNLDVPLNIDAYNYEKQTPLHLAVIYKSVESARRLLASGASTSARDGAGRAPLHLAALDDCVPLAALLLAHLHANQVNEIDGRGYTALQIACDKIISDSTIEMIKLLLDNKADPTQHQEHNLPAWQLAKLKPAIRDLFQEYIPAEQATCDSDDEFESADEGDSADEDVPEITHPLESLKLIKKDDVL